MSGFKLFANQSNEASRAEGAHDELKRIMSRVDHSLVFMDDNGRKKLIIYGGQDR